MKLSEYAQLSATMKLTDFQIKLFDETEKAIRNDTPMPIVVGMRSCKTWAIRLIREWKENYCEVYMQETAEQVADRIFETSMKPFMDKEHQLEVQLTENVTKISSLLASGKHVELCENKDGLRIISMDRKVVK